MCLLASEDHTSDADLEKVVKYTDVVLELDENNEKALFRKAKALRQLKNFSDAKLCYDKLKVIQTKGGGQVVKDVVLGLKECQNALKDYEKKEKTMYQNMFGNLSLK